MKLTLKYFASVREAVGSGHEVVQLPEGVATVGQVRAHLAARGGTWAQGLADGVGLRMAFNHVMCGPEQAVEEGGEVAFFPPVTGG